MDPKSPVRLPSQLFMAVFLLLARAAAADDAARAHFHYEKAKTLYAEGDFAEAEREYQATFDSKPEARLYFNLGQCFRMLGMAKEAVGAYSRYRQEVRNAPNAAEVDAVILELTPQAFGGAVPRNALPPRITHQTANDWPAGETIFVEATIEAFSGVVAPKLFYRAKGDNAFVPTALRASGGGRYVASIPPLAVGDVAYYLEAFDSTGHGPARHGTPSYPHRVSVRAVVDAPSPAAAPPKATSAASPASAPAGPAEPGLVRPPQASAGVQAGHSLWSYALAGAAAVAAGVGGLEGAAAQSDARSVTLPAIANDPALAKAKGDARVATGAFVAAGLLAVAGVAVFFIDR